MVSLVVRGDLKRGEDALSRKVVVRPLMYAHRRDLTDEIFAPEQLLVDAFVRAVQNLREGAAAAAPGVFIINLSLGDSNRPFFGRTSAWARAVDWLSQHYGLLFIVSAGNATGRQHDLILDGVVDETAFKALSDADRTRAVLAGLKAGLRFRRILSPAEMLATDVTLMLVSPGWASAPRKACVPGLPTVVTVATSYFSRVFATVG